MSDRVHMLFQENSCDQCRELLSDYVDHELSADERAMVELHLSSCVKCGTQSARLVGLKKVMQHWDGVKSSGEFHQVVLQQMIRESQQMPAKQFKEAAESKRALANATAAQEAEEKRLPPVWILLAAAALAVAAYYLAPILLGLL